MVVPDQWVQEAGPEEGREELHSIHQDAMSLGHYPLHLNLHFPVHTSASWMSSHGSALKSKDGTELSNYESSGTGQTNGGTSPVQVCPQVECAKDLLSAQCAELHMGRKWMSTGRNARMHLYFTCHLSSAGKEGRETDFAWWVITKVL